MTSLSQPNKYTHANGSKNIRLGFSSMYLSTISKQITERTIKKPNLNNCVNILFMTQPFCFIQVF